MFDRIGLNSRNANGPGNFLPSLSKDQYQPEQCPQPHSFTHPNSTNSTWNPAANYAQPPPTFPSTCIGPRSWRGISVPPPNMILFPPPSTANDPRFVPRGELVSDDLERFIKKQLNQTLAKSSCYAREVDVSLPPPSALFSSIPPSNLISLYPPASNALPAPNVLQTMPPMSSSLMINGPRSGFMTDDSERDFYNVFNQTPAKSSCYSREEDLTDGSTWRPIGIKSKEDYRGARRETVKPNQVDDCSSFDCKLDAAARRNPDERPAGSISENKSRRSRSRSPFGNIFRDTNRSAAANQDYPGGLPASRSPPTPLLRSPTATMSREGRFRSLSPLGGLGSKLIQDGVRLHRDCKLSDMEEIDELRRTRQKLADDEKFLEQQLCLRPNDTRMMKFLKDNTTLQRCLSRKIHQMEQELTYRNHRSSSRRCGEGDFHRDKLMERDRYRQEGRTRTSLSIR